MRSNPISKYPDRPTPTQTILPSSTLSASINAQTHKKGSRRPQKLAQSHKTTRHHREPHLAHRHHTGHGDRKSTWGTDSELGLNSPPHASTELQSLAATYRTG
jgi:hypothetical protein